MRSKLWHTVWSVRSTHHRLTKIEYCYSEKESLCYGSWTRQYCRKWKCTAECPSWSTGANPSRKQRCCYPSYLLSQAQWGTSDQENIQNLDYRLTIRHRCIDMWSWTEILDVFYQPRAKTVLILLRINTGICRLGKGHNLCQLECRLSVWKPFSRRPRKCCRLETLVYELCHLQCTCFSIQNVKCPSTTRLFTK